MMINHWLVCKMFEKFDILPNLFDLAMDDGKGTSFKTETIKSLEYKVLA